MPASYRVGVAASLILVALLLIMTWGIPEYESGVPRVGAIAPMIETVTVDGEAIRLTDYQGEWVVVNFWASWCMPCVIEMPELQSLYESYDVVVLGVNMGEFAETIEMWGMNYGITYPLLLDRNGHITRDYAIRQQPTTLVINPDGIISEIIYGLTSARVLSQAIDTAN